MRLKKFHQIGKLISGGITLGGLIYLLFFNPYLVVDSYQLSGVKTLNAEQLKGTVDHIINQKWLGVSQRNIVLLFLRKNTFVRQLKLNFPEIKTASLEPVWHPSPLRSFRLLIQERKRAGIWCSSAEKGSCFFFDDEGYLFQKSPYSKGPFILNVQDDTGMNLRLGDKIRDTRLIKALITIQKKFFQLPDISLNKVEIINLNHDLAAITNQGWKIYFDPQSDISSQFLVLETLIQKGVITSSKKIHYIDLRVSNRAYIK